MAAGGTWKKGLDLSDLQSEKRYSLFGAIGKTAVANDLLTAEQSARFEGIDFFNYGPGLVRTKTLMPKPFMCVVFNSVGRLFSRPAEAAGDDIAVLSANNLPAGFYGPKLKRNVPHFASSHPDEAKRLWEMSEQIVAAL